MGEDLQLRLAAEGEVPYLMECCLRLAGHLREVAPGPHTAGLPTQSTPGVRALATRFVTQPRARAIIAECESLRVGCLLAEIGPSEFPAGCLEAVGQITVVWVEPDYRRRGVARRLVQAAEGWFREEGVRLAELSYLARNPEATAAWERLGYGPIRVVAARELTPPQVVSPAEGGVLANFLSSLLGESEDLKRLRRIEPELRRFNRAALNDVFPLLRSPDARARRFAAELILRHRPPEPFYFLAGESASTGGLLDAALLATEYFHDENLPALKKALLYPSDQAPIGWEPVRWLIPDQPRAQLPFLERMSKCGSHQAEYLAVALLGDLGPEALPPLLRALREGNWIMRRLAANSLERMAYPEAAPALRQACADLEPSTREAVFWALARVCDASDFDRLEKALHTSHAEVRGAAAAGLARIARMQPTLELRKVLPRIRRLLSPMAGGSQRTKEALRDAARTIEEATGAHANLPLPAEASGLRRETLPIPSRGEAQAPGLLPQVGDDREERDST